MKKLCVCLALLLAALCSIAALAEGGEAEAAAFEGEVCTDAVEAAVAEAGELDLFEAAGEPEDAEGVEIAAPEDDGDAPEPPFGVAANADEGVITLYFLEDALIDRIPLPDGALTGYWISAAEGATFSVKAQSDKNAFQYTIYVTEDGYVGPKNAQDGFGKDNLESFEEVEVREGDERRSVRFHIINYAQKYANEVMDRYLATEITDDMTDLQKLVKVTEICAREFDYNGEVSGYVYMICFGGADCWGSTNFICEACRRLGVDAHGNDARDTSDPRNMHMNVRAEIGGKTYIAEAGIVGNKPRAWYVKSTDGSEHYTYGAIPDPQDVGDGEAVDVLSAEHEALQAQTGVETGFAVSTGIKARCLYMYDEDGNRMAAWNTSSAVWHKDALLWKVKYAFSQPGVRNVTFRASAVEDGPLGAGKSVTVRTQDRDLALYSAAFAVDRTAAKVRTRIDAVVGKHVRCIKGYDESGALVATWTLFENTVSRQLPDVAATYYDESAQAYMVGDQRRWSFRYEFPTTGQHTLTLRPAPDEEAEPGEGKRLSIEVVPAFPYYLYAPETLTEGNTCIIRFSTPYQTAKVAVCDEGGKILAEQAVDFGTLYNVSSDDLHGLYLYWTLEVDGLEAGERTLGVKIMLDDEDEYGPATPFGISVKPKSDATTPGQTPQVSTLRLTKDMTKKLKAGAKLNVAVPGRVVRSWKSANKAIATVTKYGVVTAVAAGTVKLTANLKGGGKRVLTLKVSDKNAPKRVKITNVNKTAKLKVGKKLQLKAKMTPVGANGTLTWSSSNNKVATVTKKGLVRAKKPGKAKITVQTQNGKKATVTIQVIGK